MLVARCFSLPLRSSKALYFETLVFYFLVSDTARFVSSFVAVGDTSISGAGTFGVDLALTR